MILSVLAESRPVPRFSCRQRMWLSVCPQRLVRFFLLVNVFQNRGYPTVFGVKALYRRH